VEIESIDHLEMFVADAESFAEEHCRSFGFAIAGRGGPETGRAGARSILLRQGEIALLVTEPLDGAHSGAEYLRRHGDGVGVVGLRVDDARAAFAEAVEKGAVPVGSPQEFGSGDDRVVFASVNGFGDVEHRFTQRTSAGGPFAPGMLGPSAPESRNAMLTAVDHLAVCLPAGELAGTVQRYRDVFGFSQTFEERIVVGTQAMDSKVVQSPSGKVTFTIIEPDTTRAPGQIDEFVSAHGGAGVQHVAYLSADIAAAVRESSERGVEYLSTPGGYYDELPARLGDVGVPLETLRELGILADRDHSGVMMQIFTRSLHPRRTLFWELIDRRGARTFGSRNITALYQAVERQRATEKVRSS
jgi:4-hydroxymandelate synthase